MIGSKQQNGFNRLTPTGQIENTRYSSDAYKPSTDNRNFYKLKQEAAKSNFGNLSAKIENNRPQEGHATQFIPKLPLASPKNNLGAP